MTAEQLAEYREAKAKKTRLEREARAIGKKTGALEQHFRAALEAAGKTELKKAGAVVRILESAGRVSWKDAFVGECGPLKAAELQEAAPATTKVAVEFA